MNLLISNWNIYIMIYIHIIFNLYIFKKNKTRIWGQGRAGRPGAQLRRPLRRGFPENGSGGSISAKKRQIWNLFLQICDSFVCLFGDSGKNPWKVSKCFLLFFLVFLRLVSKHRKCHENLMKIQQEILVHPMNPWEIKAQQPNDLKWHYPTCRVLWDPKS